ncbi:glycerate kinase type-2 family protein [Sandaracinus amylolyticus]|uniref:D-glycerate 2-kinase n=1 Tax=Sandaracinus amylolyticus TaxID=927083 RepID=A0A0F6SF35_9BACT|nr:DUF4147 domain-containing protein [Sandaracinus amylolyticus]AKF06254.1 D-glycerate 2-kinase [Sandaracinus amylolyticus]
MSAELASALARATIAAVDPRACTRDALRREGARARGPWTVLAFGKAARGMTEGALDELEVERGMVIALDGSPFAHPAITVRRGAHPAPATDAAEHGAEMEALARSLGAGDRALVLVSGGGSAMLERPVEGVGIDEIARVARALMHAGADIAELNAVRRCLSRLKGGGLAEALFPAEVLVVVISDVTDGPTSLVASGPCARPAASPDPREVIARRGVEPLLSPAARRAIATRAEHRIGDDVLASVREVVAADVGTALEGARAEAARRGLRAGVAAERIAGEARDAGPRFVRDARARCAREGFDVWIAGGESTVTVRGRGRGGRNQAAALALANEGAPHGTFVAIATDGVDGSSDAAAVWVDDDVVARAEALGLDGHALLQGDDSHAFFAATGARLVTGPTGTNVADAWIWIDHRLRRNATNR